MSKRYKEVIKTRSVESRLKMILMINPRTRAAWLKARKNSGNFPHECEPPEQIVPKEFRGPFHAFCQEPPLPTECCRRSSREAYSSAASWVAARSTGGAIPFSRASFQRGAQRHHRSPGFRPGKPYMGTGVERSFPLLLENSRNSSETMTQTP